MKDNEKENNNSKKEKKSLKDTRLNSKERIKILMQLVLGYVGIPLALLITNKGASVFSFQNLLATAVLVAALMLIFTNTAILLTDINNKLIELPANEKIRAILMFGPFIVSSITLSIWLLIYIIKIIILL